MSILKRSAHVPAFFLLPIVELSNSHSLLFQALKKSSIKCKNVPNTANFNSKRSENLVGLSLCFM
jgi:hypothetical protein